MSKLYKVEITYREKSFELRLGEFARPYHWTYHIAADTPRQAEMWATLFFDSAASRSSVGWSRKIIRIKVKEEPPSPPRPKPATLDHAPLKFLKQSDLPGYRNLRRRKTDRPEIDPKPEPEDPDPSETEGCSRV